MTSDPPSWKQSVPPSIRPDARILILGSMPGEASLAAQQYYAHKRNAFWPIMAELFGFAVTLPYPQRLQKLLENRVGLWDVLAGCRRRGSLDTAILEPEPNDLAGLLQTHPQLRHIYCNGTAAMQFLRRYQPGLTLPVTRLPSTSPAHAGMNFQQKLLHWRQITESASAANNSSPESA